MVTYIEVNGEWVEGNPADKQKFKVVGAGGFEMITYYSEPKEIEVNPEIESPD
jgi:hypothetical protein